MSETLDPRLLHAPLFRHPGGRDAAPAFLHGDVSLSYGDLTRWALLGASWLVAQGVSPGDRVALVLGKGLGTVRLIFSVLSAGAVLVPMDPQAPGARLAAQIRDCRPRLLLASEPVLNRLAPESLPEDLPRHIADAATGLPEELLVAARAVEHLPLVAGQHPALFLYTSGTTGTPKAVVLSHANVSAFTAWAIERLGIGATDRLVSHAPFFFDLSTLDLYGAVRAGASTVLLDETEVRFPARVSAILAATGATLWYSVPTALVLLLRHGALADRDLGRLRLVLFAGEPFPVPALARLMAALPQARFVNLYGPTETNVCTYQVVEAAPPPDLLSIPIGRPCEHLEVCILGPDGAPAPPGTTGEILVRGPATMLGYWERPVLTSACRHRGDPESYLTGDLGYVDRQGLLHLCGRRDDQVKIRGHRLELAEVAAVLQRQPGVAEAVALALAPAGRAEHEGLCLAAAVAAEPGADLDTATLKRRCQDWLPGYAIPEIICIMPALPRTPTGKVDKSGLRLMIEGQ